MQLIRCGVCCEGVIAAKNRSQEVESGPRVEAADVHRAQPEHDLCAVRHERDRDVNEAAFAARDGFGEGPCVVGKCVNELIHADDSVRSDHVVQHVVEQGDQRVRG